MRERRSDGKAGLGALGTARGAFLRGWRLLAIDGFEVDLPDTAPANADEFGYAGSGANRSAFPKARVVALAECGTHAFVAAEIDAYAVGEKTLVQRLYPRLRPDTPTCRTCSRRGSRSPPPRSSPGRRTRHSKLLTLIAGMCAGADSIDDIDLLRSGGVTHHLFGNVYAPSTVGTLLREFTFGHARQLESVLRELLIALTARVELLPGLAEQAFIDIDSLLRPVYGDARQGAFHGHTKIAGKQILRKGLSPLATTTISTADSTPIIAGMRLRAGKAGSGRGAGRMVTQAIVTARAAGATGALVVRGDSAYGTRAVISACLRGKVCSGLFI